MPTEKPAAFIRYPSHVPVHCRPHREALNGHDVTPGGICFASGEPFAPGVLVKLSLGAPHGVEHFTAKVAWSKPRGTEYVTGACLLDDADACRARMVAQLCHIDAYRRREQAQGRLLDDDAAASEWIERYAHEVPAIT